MRIERKWEQNPTRFRRLRERRWNRLSIWRYALLLVLALLIMSLLRTP